ncbi:MAG TPA: hypothetical protein DG048_11680 [Pseudoalteromonas sp.]|nr:hypothetical protein [Pseudoalteromonas sp.]|tara:strand:- start:678 stop:1460 length:783 start_codon:yes stop_codon:yes gene_type:complete
MATSKNVAGSKKNEVVEFDQSLFEADAGVGLDMAQEDLALPFIKVLSRQDPTLDNLDDAKAGDIYNTVTGEVYSGKTGIVVIPCAYQRRFIEWSPRGIGSGAPVNIFTPEQALPQVERSPEDNKDYVVGGNGSYLEETAQHFVLVLGEDGMPTTALIAMKSTQLKKSRKWNSMVLGRKLIGTNGNVYTPARFSHQYLLKTVSEENSKGSWHGWEISLDKRVDDHGLYQQAKAFAVSIGAGDVEVKHQDESGTSQENEAPF